MKKRSLAFGLFLALSSISTSTLASNFFLNPSKVDTAEVITTSGSSTVEYEITTTLGNWTVNPSPAYVAAAAACLTGQAGEPATYNPKKAVFKSDHAGASALWSLVLSAKATDVRVTLVGSCGADFDHFDVNRIILMAE